MKIFTFRTNKNDYVFISCRARDDLHMKHPCRKPIQPQPFNSCHSILYTHMCFEKATKIWHVKKARPNCLTKKRPRRFAKMPSPISCGTSKYFSKSKEDQGTSGFESPAIFKEISTNHWETIGNLPQCIQQKWYKSPTNKCLNWGNPGSLTRA